MKQIHDIEPNKPHHFIPKFKPQEYFIAMQLTH